MGQKVNPHGLRVGVIKDWDSRWFANKKDFGATLVEDYNLRKTLKAQLYNFGISKIEIERDGKKVKISIHCAKPGLVIGKGGSEIEKLRAQCEKMLGKPVAINIVEVKAPELDAQLVAESIAQQLEKRISFRRAMKMSIGNAMRRGAKGTQQGVRGSGKGTQGCGHHERWHWRGRRSSQAGEIQGFPSEQAGRIQGLCSRAGTATKGFERCRSQGARGSQQEKGSFDGRATENDERHDTDHGRRSFRVLRERG